MIGNEKQIDYAKASIIVSFYSTKEFVAELSLSSIILRIDIVQRFSLVRNCPKDILEVRPKGTNTTAKERRLTKSRPINNVRPRMPQPTQMPSN